VVRSQFRVNAGCCSDCAGDLAGGLGALPGVHDVQVLGASGLVVVDHDGTVTDEAVRRLAADAGLGLVPATRPGVALTVVC